VRVAVVVASGGIADVVRLIGWGVPDVEIPWAFKGYP
jgi:hypothetical protein